ncbi:mesoderm induction early response protein 1-like [Clytia hemisphaerica]|uniref:Mesoderm induction early response protein 1 n=1 Tax=Clytia hemisphaerica TaxID=252671 RepID=A0A7M5XJ21_9CNID
MAENVIKQQIPSLKNETKEENDKEFELTAEMMIDEEDYEGTIDEEEDMDDEDDDEDELADLQKEGDMPIEQLLAMYYQNGDQEAATTEPTTQPTVKTEQSGEGTTIENTNNGDVGENQMNGNIDESDDPFQNQRITRGLAALNSQYFDEDYSSDEDYQPTDPPIDDWKKEIQIGDNHQAEVDEGLTVYSKDEKTLDAGDKLLWTPSVISPEKLTSYLDLVYKLSEFGSQRSDRDDEQALFTLLQTRDVSAALKKRHEQDRQPPDVSLWSEEECQNFEQGLRVFGKDFRLIQKNKVQTRTVGEIVQFYYLWKKTERHDAFVTQTKLGRRKYTLPGIADMMGRFMEESDPLFTNQPISPTGDENHSTTHSNHYSNHTTIQDGAQSYNNTNNINNVQIKTEQHLTDYQHQKENQYGRSSYAPNYAQSVSQSRAADESWRTTQSPISMTN